MRYRGAQRYGHKAIQRNANSAAYGRPRFANASGSRNVIAIGESPPVWYHYDTTSCQNASGQCDPVFHRYAAFFVLPVRACQRRSNSAGVRLPNEECRRSVL